MNTLQIQLFTVDTDSTLKLLTHKLSNVNSTAMLFTDLLSTEDSIEELFSLLLSSVDSTLLLSFIDSTGELFTY